MQTRAEAEEAIAGNAEEAIAGNAKAGFAGDGSLPRAAFRDVFAVAEFRALWLAQILSVGGDQLARVALTFLVYDRTRSASDHDVVHQPRRRA